MGQAITAERSHLGPGTLARRGDSPRSLCETALHQLHTGQGQPSTLVDAALRADPACLAAHCLRAAWLVMSCRLDRLGELAQTLDAARRVGRLADERERRHLAAAAAWLDKDLKRALRLYGEIAADHPHDTLALRVAHFGDLQWGRTQALRDRTAAVLPHWHEGIDGYEQVLAMYAFGLAENGEHERAVAVGRRALRLDREAAGAVHAVAHALENQGRAEEGLRWLRCTAGDWTHSDGYAPRLWWHMALCQLDLDEPAAALQIYDRALRRGLCAASSVLVDASALLWRLQLRGIDVAARWHELAEAWAAQCAASLRPFNDTHAMLAFVADSRRDEAAALVERLRAGAACTHDLDPIVQDAALPVCEALQAFGARDYHRAAAILDGVRHLAQRCGGSLAQCDLLHLTLLESALRSGQRAMARALAEERIAARPHSRYNRQLLQRVAGLGRGRLRHRRIGFSAPVAAARAARPPAVGLQPA
jgi:tetratricopeptide (TPR) repeat protein